MLSRNAKRPTYLFAASHALHRERNIRDQIQRQQPNTHQVADRASQVRGHQRCANRPQQLSRGMLDRH